MSSSALRLLKKQQDCDLCVHPDHAKIVEDYHIGNINTNLAAEQFGVSVSRFKTHLNHIQNDIATAVIPELGNLPKRIVDEANEIIDQMGRLKEVLKVKREQIFAQRLSDPKEVKVYLAIEDMLDKNVNSLARITGKLNNNQPSINITNIQLEHDNFRTQILNLLCTTCKSAIANLEK